jgi:hypothetical protein
MSEELFDEGLSDMEAGLASLQWKASGIDRDQLMYLAGQASVSGTRVDSRSSVLHALWPLVTAASLLMAVTMGGAMLLGQKSQTVERIVYVPVDRPVDSQAEESLPAVAADKPAESLPRADYLVRRWIALTQGVDALPEIDVPTTSEIDNAAPQQIYSRPINLDLSG